MARSYSFQVPALDVRTDQEVVDVDSVKANPIWPVDLDTVRLWPMEGEDGPLLQELFDDTCSGGLRQRPRPEEAPSSADWFVEPTSEASILPGAADIQCTTFRTGPTINWLQSHFDTVTRIA
jgi:hypothetical protein